MLTSSNCPLRKFPRRLYVTQCFVRGSLFFSVAPAVEGPEAWPGIAIRASSQGLSMMGIQVGSDMTDRAALACGASNI